MPHSRNTFFIFIFLICLSLPALAESSQQGSSSVAWWVWPLSLLIVSFLIGIVGVLGGVGGGVLFVPIVSGFFPFHLDFVRGAGLLIALAGALAASPKLLKTGMADVRLVMPLALIASISEFVSLLIPALSFRKPIEVR